MASAARSFRSTWGSLREAPEYSKHRIPTPTPHVGHGTEDNCLGVRPAILIHSECANAVCETVPFKTFPNLPWINRTGDESHSLELRSGRWKTDSALQARQSRFSPSAEKSGLGATRKGVAVGGQNLSRFQYLTCANLSVPTGSCCLTFGRTCWRRKYSRTILPAASKTVFFDTFHDAYASVLYTFLAFGKDSYERSHDLPLAIRISIGNFRNR
jgi:hypothetical protein